MIQKGKVSTIINDGKYVTITPYNGGIVSAPITVPYFLIGALHVNTPVVYVDFEDNTGVVLSRMDGGWNNSVVNVPDGMQRIRWASDGTVYLPGDQIINGSIWIQINDRRYECVIQGTISVDNGVMSGSLFEISLGGVYTSNISIERYDSDLGGYVLAGYTLARDLTSGSYCISSE